jgi:hypothetical protein
MLIYENLIAENQEAYCKHPGDVERESNKHSRLAAGSQ